MTETVSGVEESFSYEWVEIIEPRRREHMYANLKTGQCLWEPPENVPVKPTHENQWWELYDTNTRRYYYYNATSQQTIWRKPTDGDIIALAKLQMLKARETRKLSNDYSIQTSLAEPLESIVSAHSSTLANNGKSNILKHSPPKSAKFSKGVSFDIADSNHVDARDCEPKNSALDLHSLDDGPLNADPAALPKAGLENNNSLPSGVKELQIHVDIAVSGVCLKTPGEVLSESCTPTKTIMQCDRNQTLELMPTRGAVTTGDPVGRADTPANIDPPVGIVSVSRTRGEPILPVDGSGSPESSSDRRLEQKPLARCGVLQKSASMRTADFSHADDVDEKVKFNSLRQDRCRSNTEALESQVGREGSLKRAPPKPPRSSILFEAARTTPHEAAVSGSAGSSPTVAGNVARSLSIREKVMSLGKELSESAEVEGGCAPATRPSLPTASRRLSLFTSPEANKPTWKINPSRSPILRCRTIERPSRMPPAAPGDRSAATPSPPPPPPLSPTPLSSTTPLPSPRGLLPQPGHARQSSPSAPEKKMSVYDNLGDTEADAEVEPMSVSPTVGGCTLPSQVLDKGFSDSSGSCSPSDSLVRNGPSSPYSDHYSSINPRSSSSVVSLVGGSANAADAVGSGLDHERVKKAASTPPAISQILKRNPLQRMKSDSSEVEKRAKLAGGTAGGFRPVSMMNVTGVRKPSLRQPLGSDSDMPEQMPLNTHRQGILRRRMSIHSMLSWSKTPIKKPMVLTRDKHLKKAAIEMFKLVLQYMGDKASKRSPNNIAVDVTTKGWTTPALRDEIFVQLCKQTTGNEKVLSLQRGWELMAACLSHFPPSNKFHSYLEGYIYRHLEPEEDPPGVPVSQYAKHCYKQLERICLSGAKRGNKKPTADDIDAAKDAVFNPSMFGNTFDDIMEMQELRFPGYRLPWILTALTEAVLMENGLATEGIFRVPGDIDEVNSLKIATDKWQMPTRLKDPHVPASLLKLWFRESYEPVIPQRFYDTCIHNCDSAVVSLGVVNQLPEMNRLIFCYLIRFLQAFMIPSNVARTKMDDNNLAMVWAPNCLRCPSNDPREIFENTRMEMTFLRTVMKSLDTSFLQGIV